MLIPTDRIMIICPRTGSAVPAGIELPEGSDFTATRRPSFNALFVHQHAVGRPFFENAGPTAFDKYWVVLDRSPLIAAEIGVLISCAAMGNGTCLN